jgi:Domain of unknown function (DUF3854)
MSRPTPDLAEYGGRLFEQHAGMLASSGVTPDHARARGYLTVDTKKRLEDIGVTKAGQRVPGLLVPLLRAEGSVWGYQYRPDEPRVNSAGRPVKYETPTRQRNGIDVPPGVGAMLDDPTIPLWVTEGSKKADAAALAALCCVALPGVWSWLGTSGKGGKVAVSDWRDVALNGRRVVLAFDGDVARKRPVRSALLALAEYLAGKGAAVEYLHLPDDDANKVGLDDYLLHHGLEELRALVRPDPPPMAADDQAAEMPPATVPPATPVPLPDALATFRRWLHLDDTGPVLAVAAAVVANMAPGDPVWLLIVGPPSGGKTEVLASVMPLPMVVAAATISEAALLSGTSQRERAKNATGGLLRQVGDFGILLAKDFTSVLAQNRDTARAAMAALREVYDGRWDRPVGSDGGKILHWSGKCGFIGGVTPSYDRYGAIVNTLGDRYLLLRLPDVDARSQAVSALAQAEHETAMRTELAAAMTGLIATADLTRVHAPLNNTETEALVVLSSFTARARTVVERDGYTGELLVMPQAEGPARLIKAMRRMYGALGALGVDDATRWDVLIRMALDCGPAIRTPLMRALLLAHQPTRTRDLAQTAGLVTKTANRQLDDLHLLGIAEHSKVSEADNSTDLWTASPWLRDHWPEEVRQRCTTHPLTPLKEGQENTASDDVDRVASPPSLTCLSYIDQLGLAGADGRCPHGFAPEQIPDLHQCDGLAS